MSLYETVYGTLVDPVSTFRIMREKETLKQGIVILILLFIFFYLNDAGKLMNNISQNPALSELNINLSGSYWFYPLIGLPLYLVGWFIISSLYGLLGSLYCNRTNPRALMNMLAFSLLPGIFSVPLQLGLQAFGWQAGSIVVSLVFWIWVMVLQIIGLKEILDVETGQAVAIWITPLAVGFVIMVLGIISLSASIASMFI
ncbi:MAG: YIP1 family protein [Chitinophagales bacterium]